MRFPTISTLLSAFSFLGANARLIGIQAPATIASGSSFEVALLTDEYIQSVYDVGVGFGIAPGAGYPDSLGETFASEVLGPALSNQLYPVNFTVQLPSGYPPQGPALLSAALLSLYGVEAEPVVALFNVSVTVGTVTSMEMVSSTIYNY